MSKTLDGKLSISRPSGSDEPYIKIAIEDKLSRVEFLEINIPLEEFAEALTGLALRPVTLKVRSLDKVGKVKEGKSLNFVVKTKGDRKEYAEQNAQSHADEGWTASTYFGSQLSFSSIDGITFAHGCQYRYVEVNNEA